MTLNLSLSPQSEARLRERAAAAGKDVATFVREAVEEKLASAGVTGAEMAAAQWSNELHAWAAKHRPPAQVVDDSREGIYAGRGE
jgi:plasmid stability protein